MVTGKEITLKYYDNSKSDEENADANANFSYDEDKKQGTIVVSFTDKNLYNKTYKVNTVEASELDSCMLWTRCRK